MFIVWGTKKINKKQGFAADFCLTCSEIKAFEIHKQVWRSHIYYLPYGKAKDEQHTKCCQTCQTLQLADINDYTSVIKTKKNNMDLDVLVFNTHENIHEVYKQRLELEKQIKKGKHAVGDEKWALLLREPFEIFEQKLTQFNSQTQIDYVSLLFIVNAFIFPFLVSFALSYLSINVDIKQNIILMSIAFGVGLAIFQQIKVTRRHVRKKLYPGLAQSLLKFKGYESDIEQTFEQLKTQGFKVTKKGKYSELSDLIKA